MQIDEKLLPSNKKFGYFFTIVFLLYFYIFFIIQMLMYMEFFLA